MCEGRGGASICLHRTMFLNPEVGTVSVHLPFSARVCACAYVYVYDQVTGFKQSHVLGVSTGAGSSLTQIWG